MPIGTDRNIMGESALPMAAVMPALGAQEGVANMQKMFQSGFITADDIAKRADVRNAMKEDLDIRAMQEQRAMAPKIAELKRQETEAALAASKYGPGIQLFQTLAPQAGVSEVPKLPDGSIDYATMAEQGGKLASWMAERQKASEEILPIPGLTQTIENADGSKTAVFVNKFGAQLSPEYQQALNRKMTRSFKDFVGAMEPGSVSAPAKPAPGAVGQLTPTAAIPSVSIDAIQSAPTTPAAGINLGVSQATTIAKQKADAEARTASVDAESARQKAVELGGQIDEGLQIVMGRNAPVGAFQGSGFGQLLNQTKAFFGVNAEPYSQQDKLRGLVGKRVLEGSSQMKGNLSDKDINFLKASYPSLGSTQQRWISYLGVWKKMNDANLEVMAGKREKGSSTLSDLEPVPKDSEHVDAVVARADGQVAGSSEDTAVPWDPTQPVPAGITWLRLPDGRAVHRK